MKSDIRTLLNRLLELIQPNNYKVDNIKKADAEAKKEIIIKRDELNKALEDATAAIEKVEKENDEFTLDLDALDENIKGLLGWNDKFTPLCKEYINVLESNNIPLDFPKITQACKLKVEMSENKIKELNTKLENNNNIKLEAEEVINTTPGQLEILDNQEKTITTETSMKLEEEARIRGEVANLITTLLEDPTEINRRRINEVLETLKEFSDEEIKVIAPIINAPKENVNGYIFEKIYQTYNDGRGKSTKEMLKEAMNNDSKDKKESNSSTKERINSLLKVESVEDIEKEQVEAVNDEPIEVVSEEVKTGDNINKDPKREYIMDELGVDDIDIDLVPEIMEVPQMSLEQMVQKAKAANIDPKSISLRNYCGDFEQYLNNIKEMKDANLPVDEQTILKNPLIGAIPTERIKNINTLVNYNGLSVVKPNGKIAVDVFAREPKKLKRSISLLGPIDLSYYVNHPENMPKITVGVATRITFCQQNGINYKDENGNFESFIENGKEFEELFGKVSKDIIPSAKLFNQKLLETVEDKMIVKQLNDYYKSDSLETISLDKTALDKFISLNEMVQSLNESEKPYEICIGGEIFYNVDFQRNLSYLLSLNPISSDNDLIMTSLMFNAHKNPEAIKVVSRQLNPNTRDMKIAA